MDKRLNGKFQKEEIEANLTTAWLGRPLYYFSEVTSTNDILKEMAEDGAVEGTLALTDYQSQGKGRHSRSWTASPGSSLLLSLLFRPTWSMDLAHWLVMMAGLAVKEVIEAVCGLEAILKWPNDVLVSVEKEYRKVAGILIEMTGAGQKVEYAVLGIGINVNNRKSDFFGLPTPGTSLYLAGGDPVDRLPLLVKFLEIMERRYSEGQQYNSPKDDWERALINIGSEVTVSASGSDMRITGQAVGTDMYGRLLVKSSDGTTHVISAADVTLRG